MPKTLLEIKNLSKYFPENGVIACNDISTSFRGGEITAIAGENGAGKSTFTNILSGRLKPDSGKIIINNREVFPGSPQAAASNGIYITGQYPPRAPGLTILETIIQGTSYVSDYGFFSKKKLESTLRERSKEYQMEDLFDIDPLQITSGQRYQLEILHIILNNPSIIIFDEPTSVLTEGKTKWFFNLINRLKEQGCIVLLITHRLEEIFEYADNVCVLRKGSLKAVSKLNKINESILSEWMTGEVVKSIKALPRKDIKTTETRLELKDLCKSYEGSTKLDHINLKIKSSTITGIAGIRENGLDLLEEILSGMTSQDSGSILYYKSDGKPRTYLPGRHQLAYIPTDRLGRGASIDATLSENMILLRYKDLYKIGFFLKKSIKDFVSHLIENFSIKGHPKQKLGQLSGGNIQKVILSRELSGNPEIIILAEPGWGLDEKSKQVLYNKLLQIREEGTAIFILSTDIEETLILSDFIYVLSNKKIEGPYPSSSLDKSELGRMMLGAKR